MTAEPIIRVEELTAKYGGNLVFDRVSFDVQRGEVFVILGGSGCGKSTMLKHMIGLYTPFAGRIWIDGDEITGSEGAERQRILRKIGVMYQSGALFGSMTLLENVTLAMEELTDLPPDARDAIARSKLKLVQLEGFEDYLPAEISGGMKKRAAIARAMSLDPEILFLDEPSAGLDPITSAELDDLILQLRDALAMTIVVITHELESALKIADRIAVLGGGRILLTGTVDEVRASEDEHVRRLLERRARDGPVDSEAYLARLTGDE